MDRISNQSILNHLRSVIPIIALGDEAKEGGKKILEKAKNVIEIKVCVESLDDLKKFIKKMEQEYGSTHTLVYKVDVFDVKRL